MEVITTIGFVCSFVFFSGVAIVTTVTLFSWTMLLFELIFPGFKVEYSAVQAIN